MTQSKDKNNKRGREGNLWRHYSSHMVVPLSEQGWAESSGTVAIVVVHQHPGEAGEERKNKWGF